jgi:DNA-binding transcriptional ArsR family regulator
MRGLDDRALEEVARYFAALSVPTRLKILNALREGERNVTELISATGCTQANASKHLALMTQHGLVERSARGVNMYYRIADPRIYALCDMVCSQLGKRYANQADLGQTFASVRKASKAKRRRPRTAAASSR